MYVGPRLRTAILLGCFAAAFIATHLPPPLAPKPPLLSDKMEHFLGFAALGAVTIWRIAGRKQPIALLALIGWLGALAAYGLFDEITQPYFSRSFEWSDWAADVAGAVAGLSAAAIGHRYSIRIRGRESLGRNRTHAP